MKWKLAGVLMCALSLLGCNNDVQEPKTEKKVTLNTSMGRVVLQDVALDTSLKQVTVRVVGDQIDATLLMSATGAGSLVTNVEASLVDASGELLYLIGAAVDEGAGQVTYREATAEDYVTCSVREDNGRVFEVYDANGDVSAFEYPALSNAEQQKAINHFEHGLPVDYLPAEMAEYVSQAGAFHAYYLPHSTSSIYNNPAGELLVQLVSSPEMSQLVAGDGPRPEQVSKIIEYFCGWANACSIFSCRLFPGSVVCSVCSGAAVACILFTMMADGFGWH